MYYNNSSGNKSEHETNRSILVTSLSFLGGALLSYTNLTKNFEAMDIDTTELKKINGTLNAELNNLRKTLEKQDEIMKKNEEKINNLNLQVQDNISKLNSCQVSLEATFQNNNNNHLSSIKEHGLLLNIPSFIQINLDILSNIEYRKRLVEDYKRVLLNNWLGISLFDSNFEIKNEDSLLNLNITSNDSFLLMLSAGMYQLTLLGIIA